MNKCKKNQYYKYSTEICQDKNELLYYLLINGRSYTKKFGDLNNDEIKYLKNIKNKILKEIEKKQRPVYEKILKQIEKEERKKKEQILKKFNDDQIKKKKMEEDEQELKNIILKETYKKEFETKINKIIENYKDELTKKNPELELKELKQLIKKKREEYKMVYDENGFEIVNIYHEEQNIKSSSYNLYDKIIEKLKNTKVIISLVLVIIIFLYFIFVNKSE